MSQAKKIISDRDALFVNMLNAQKVYSTNPLDIDVKKPAKVKFIKRQTSKTSEDTRFSTNVRTDLKFIKKNYKDSSKSLASNLFKTGLIVAGLTIAAKEIKKIYEQGFTLEDINFKSTEKLGEFGSFGEQERSDLSSGKLSDKGKKFIAKEEGIKTTAYKDIKGIWTIGIGHTGKVDGKRIGPGMMITEQKAMELFNKDVEKFEKYVNKVVKVPVSQNMFDAMVSYAFNTGSLGPKFLKKLNSGDYEGAMQELTTINTELEGRRSREQKLFGSDISKDNKLSTRAINRAPTKISKIRNESNGISYANTSNITSKTKLTSGYNKYYKPNKKTKSGMGTFMGKRITSGIGHRNIDHSKQDGSDFHKGLDLAYSFGDSVKAFCAGKVTSAGRIGGFGKTVIIDDIQGFRHIYAHLSVIMVSVGNIVKKGQLIGKSGGSGKNSDHDYPPHLHYGIWKPGGKGDRDYIDPRTYSYPGDEPINRSEYNLTNKHDLQATTNSKQAVLPNKKYNKKKDKPTKVSTDFLIKESSSSKAFTPIKFSFNQNYKNTRESEERDSIYSII